MPELAVPIGLVAVAGGYAALVARRWRSGTAAGPPVGLAAAFLAGLAVLALALASPLDAAAHRHLTAHMVQHVLLVSVAAPLLAAGRPLAAAGLTWRWPRPRPWLVLALTGVVQVTTLCAWHVPALYDAALRHDQVHALEHASLLLTAVALWAALDRLGGEAAGAGVGVLFVVTLPAMALGVAMTLAHTSWYPAYAHTDDPLADQQMAGVVMWAYAGLAAVLAGVIVVVKWFGRLERRLPGSTVTVVPPIGTAPPC